MTTPKAGTDGHPVKKTIALDFDGVVHMYTTPWSSATEIADEPVEGAFQFIMDALEYGFEVAIFSLRNRQPGGIEAMSEWMLEHGLPGWVIDQLAFPEHKPPAVLYIDDRGYCFHGNFPRLAWIDSFVPWNRRG